MDIQNTRFGTIVYDESRALTLPAGMIGFSRETRFIFLEPPAGRRVAWLQSLISPELAFPVVGAALFGDAYPSPGLYELGRRARLVRSPEDELTALVVVAAPRGSGRIANLLAPIVINLDTRMGAQVVLDADVYSAAAPFDLDYPLLAPPASGLNLAGAALPVAT